MLFLPGGIASISPEWLRSALVGRLAAGTRPGRARWDQEVTVESWAGNPNQGG